VKKLEDSLKKRYSIKLFSSIISGIIGAILVAIVPKALGPVAYGQFVYLQDFFMKVLGFLDMGSSIAFFTKLSAKHTRKELITFYFLYTIVVLIVVLLSMFTIDNLGYIDKVLPNIPHAYIYMGLFFGFFTWLTQIFIKISDAYALTVSVEMIKIGHKIVSLGLLLYFVYFIDFDLHNYFYFHYIALISFLLLLIWLFVKKDIFTKKLFKIQNLQFKMIAKEFMEYCHPLLAYSLIGLVVGFLNIWMLQTYGGSTQTGFYGLAYSLAAICFLFTSAMTPIITREFSKAYGEDDIKKMKKLFYRYIPMLYSLAAYFGIFISMQSDNVLAIFTDEKFKDASMVLMVMAFYPIHQTYGQLSNSIFYATGQTTLYRNIAFFTQPLMLLLSYVLIVQFDLGAIGLAVSMLTTQFIGTNIGLYFNAKFLDLDLKYFISHQLYSIGFFVVLAYMSSNIFNMNSTILEFLVAGTLYTFFVIISTYIIPQVFATNRDEIKHYLMKVKYVIKK
jgi:O-antigen/teichoic acid export membrane protein